MRPLAKYRKSRMWHQAQKHHKYQERKLSALRNEEPIPDCTSSSHDDPFNTSKNKSGHFDRSHSFVHQNLESSMQRSKDMELAFDDNQEDKEERNDQGAENQQAYLEGYLNDPTESGKSDSETQHQLWQKIAFKDSNNKIKGTKTLNHTDANHIRQQLNYLKKHNFLDGLPQPMVQELARVQEPSPCEQDIDPQGNTQSINPQVISQNLNENNEER